MKTFGFNTVLITIFSFLVLSTNGQVAERNINMEFDADKNTNINIDSRFGKVEILTWEKPVVSIEVFLKAESDSRDLSNEILQKLNSEITRQGNEILIKTIIEERITSSSRRKVKFSVDYTINVPEWIHLKLVNRYGTVFIERIDGLADITVQYGNLTIRELGRGNEKPLNQVTLAYSRGTIDKASWLKTDLSYSKLSIDEARAVVAVSKYSSLSSDRLNSLVADSRYDTYSVSFLNNFAGQMRYANLKLNEVTGKMDITSSYTNVRVEKVLPGFESLVIENSRGNYRLNISKDSSFQLNGEALRGDIQVDGMSELSRKVVNADKTVWGTYGNTSGAGEIKIRTSDGSVRMAIL